MGLSFSLVQFWSIYSRSNSSRSVQSMSGVWTSKVVEECSVFFQLLITGTLGAQNTPNTGRVMQLPLFWTVFALRLSAQSCAHVLLTTSPSPFGFVPEIRIVVNANSNSTQNC